MISIDMEIHTSNWPHLHYHRLSAPTRKELSDLIAIKAREWAEEGFWTAATHSENGKPVYYPAHRVESVTTYGNEPFGTEEVA